MIINLIRFLFLLGLLLSPLIFSLFATPINVNIEKSYILVMLGGLLVGFGTTLAQVVPVAMAFVVSLAFRLDP